ncbi:hypothetical protein HUG15_19785 [Salicibibacter cibarius]|uniref:Uncharacterized protein n=1 Tax=Salicibibacter cibarius TaxID=2743000 RepID=A0A7T6Z6B7_9BACI|nr:STM3941 family protein [Salicibibacter cibarius]QQK77603.1 hypothetical protein HUG15_19785 [Salicibibacter cibarius]
MFEELHFYESKEKNALILIAALLFVLAVSYFAYVGMVEEEPYDIAMGTLGAVFFLVAFIFGLVRLLSAKPYVTLTKEHLVLYLMPNMPIEIKFEDIAGYMPYATRHQNFIGIVLHNEEEYSVLMPLAMQKTAEVNKEMGIPVFGITWNRLKKKDQLLYELERRTPKLQETRD